MHLLIAPVVLLMLELAIDLEDDMALFALTITI